MRDHGRNVTARKKIVALAGQINPATGKPFSLKAIGNKAGGLSKERVRQILKSERASKPSAGSVQPTEAQLARAIKLAGERDPVTGLYLYSDREISKKTGVQLGKVRAAIAGIMKRGEYRRLYNSLSPTAREIIRLGSIHRIDNKKPLFTQWEIARQVKMKNLRSLNFRLKKYGIKRTTDLGKRKAK